ncbi:MAG: hypothetical protein AB7W59_28865 [Acidimicrobiia bacterium]
MPVSLRLLDATAAGTQTLRLLTALVCSVSVTTAVAGPMAYRAIEFRNSADDAASVLVVDDPARVPAFAVERGVLDAGQQFAVAGASAAAAATSTSASAATTASTASATASTAAVRSGEVSTTSSSPIPPDLPPAAAPAAAPPATAVPPAVPVAVAPTTAPVGAVAGTPAVQDVAPPVAAPTTTTAPNNALDEFNPRRACDDKAQELNVGNDNTVCNPTSQP